MVFFSGATMSSSGAGGAAVAPCAARLSSAARRPASTRFRSRPSLPGVASARSTLAPLRFSLPSKPRHRAAAKWTPRSALWYLARILARALVAAARNVPLIDDTWPMARPSGGGRPLNKASSAALVLPWSSQAVRSCISTSSAASASSASRKTSGFGTASASSNAKGAPQAKSAVRPPGPWHASRSPTRSRAARVHGATPSTRQNAAARRRCASSPARSMSSSGCFDLAAATAAFVSKSR
mmetsp:Transcript_6393/g.21907  ORF Transcript_6393/g.21907 Transcript_6393/m.21907 type:complete len:240 (+) Transcript_6393:700-1419(+)